MTEADIQDTLQSIGRSLAVALGASPIWHVGHSPVWRKPAPGMIYAACNLFSVALHEAIYGGDLDSDKEAAQNAGVRFVNSLPAVLLVAEEIAGRARLAEEG